MGKSNRKIVEIKCNSCKTLLLRGELAYPNDGYSGAKILDNIRPRKNAIIKKFSYKAMQDFGNKYYPEDSVRCDFNVDITCRNCGKSHPNIISEHFSYTYATYNDEIY